MEGKLVSRRNNSTLKKYSLGLFFLSQILAKMLKLIPFICFVCSCAGMSMVAKSSKTMTVTSPDGAKKMFVEHSSTSDLDSSASGYIYQSDGKNPATIVHLGEAQYQEPHEFSQLLNRGYEPLIQPSVYDGKYVQEKGEENEEGYYADGGEKGEKGYKGKIWLVLGEFKVEFKILKDVFGIWVICALVKFF